MSSVHTRNSMICPSALVSLRESSPSTASLPARLEHLSRVAHCADSVEPELDPMVGANRVAPGDQVMRLAGPDEREQCLAHCQGPSRCRLSWALWRNARTHSVADRAGFLRPCPPL